jgi:hypothetical protein
MVGDFLFYTSPLTKKEDTMTTTTKGIIDFARDGLNNNKDMLTEFTGKNDPDELYLFFFDKGYTVSHEDCVKIAQAKEKFEEVNPPSEGTPPVTY